MKTRVSVSWAVVMCTALAACGSDDVEYTELGTNSTQTEENLGQAFSIINELGDSVKELYISQSSMSDWGENLLGDTLLADGVTVDILLSGAPLATMIFDIAVIMEDGEEYQIKNVDVSVSKQVELKIKNGKAIANMK